MKDLNQRLDDLFLELEIDSSPITPEQENHQGWSWECDSRGYYTACSPEVNNILGISPDSFIGQPLSSFRLSPQSRKKLEIFLGTQSSEREVELQFRTISGDLIPVTMKISYGSHEGENGRAIYGYAQIHVEGDRTTSINASPSQSSAAKEVLPIEGGIGAFEDHSTNFTSSTFTPDLLIDVGDGVRELSITNRAVSQVVESTDLEATLRGVLNELGKKLDIYSGNVLLFNPNYTLQTIIAEYSIYPNFLPAAGTEFPLNWISEIVITTRDNLIIQDGHTNIKTKPIYELMRAQGIQSRAIFPLIIQDEVIGTINLDLIEAYRKFTPDDIRLAETLISRSLTSFQNTNLNE